MKPSPNVNLTNLRLRLADATLEREHLRKELKSCPTNGTQAKNIRQQVESLKDMLDCFSADYIQRAKIKWLKLDKHKRWKKRRKERLKAQRQEREKSSVLSSVRGEPTVFTLRLPGRQDSSRDQGKELQQQQQQQQQQKTQQQRMKTKAQQNRKTRQQQRIQHLTTVVEKLMHVRDLRRNKLETRGHFFAEAGDAYYNKIKSSVSSITVEHDTKNDCFDDGKQQEGHQMPIRPHAQDQWNGQPLDLNAYGYWLQGWENVDKLRRIRQQWDQYLVNDETSSSIEWTSASKIPPTMVSPSLPSSHLWARYLE